MPQSTMHKGLAACYVNRLIDLTKNFTSVLPPDMFFSYLIKYLFPNPQEGYSANGAKYEVGEIALAKQFDVQQMADKGTYITANDADDKVHAASFAFTTHDAVSNITN